MIKTIITIGIYVQIHLPIIRDQVDVNNNVILKMASYGELGDDI